MQILHLSFLVLFVGPIVWGLYGYFRFHRNQPSSPAAGASGALIINSAILYALAFNLIFFIQEFFLALGKKLLGLHAILYHNNHNWVGSHPKEMLAQGEGALAIFITGVICLAVFLIVRAQKNKISLFLFWLFFQAFMQALPQVAAAALAPDDDVGQAMVYLGIPLSWKIALGVGAIFLMILLASFSARYLLEYAPSKAWLETPAQRWRYITKIALIPALLGIALIIPFRLPPLSRIEAPIMVTIASVPWIVANYWRVEDATPHDHEANEKLQTIPIMALMVLLAIFQFILRKGIRF